MLKKIGETIFEINIIAAAISTVITFIVAIVNKFVDIETIGVICGTAMLILLLSIISISFPLTIILTVIDVFKENSKKES